MHKFWNIPILRVIVAYLVNSFVITSLAFILYQYTNMILLYHTNLWPLGNLVLFLHFVPQYLIYAVETAVVYFMVVRPFDLKSLFDKVDEVKHFITVLLCILLVFVSAFRFHAVFTVRNGIEILTFMIVGLSEEWMFRGVLTRVFKDLFGIVWAVLITSALFAMYHWAEIGFADGKKPFTEDHFIALGNDFLFGLVFSIIVWRSRSILWGAFVHCMIDWHPPLRHWGLTTHSLWLGGEAVQILLMGLIGAELIRFYGHRKSNKINRTETVSKL